MLQHNICTIITLNYWEMYLCKEHEGQNLCGSAILILKHKYHWISKTLNIFVCLFDFIMHDFQISVSYHFPFDFQNVPELSSGCYPFALIHHAWKQIHNSCPPPLSHTSYHTCQFLFSIVVPFILAQILSRFSHIVCFLCSCDLLLSFATIWYLSLYPFLSIPMIITLS